VYFNSYNKGITMKKLMLTLLMSGVVGTVCAADSTAKAKETAVWALQTAGTRVLPAVAGYVAASVVKESVRSPYCFIAFLGLVGTPFALDTQKAECYKNVPAGVKTGLNSFALGAAARGCVSLVPATVTRLAELRSHGR
jgi:hypothetical protein